MPAARPRLPSLASDNDQASRSVGGQKRRHSGRAQLSLVEHALCPVDPRASLRDHLVHETTYGYMDRNRHLKLAQVRITCPAGLSPADEFVLWGMLALTFAQPEPSVDFHATPHFCMRQLGLIESNQSKGGKDYNLFRETVRRLARVIYENTAFYDPIRGEHRDVAFGLLKYSLPIDPASSRAWRFVWDQQFFEFSQATGGALWFDLKTYRRLSFASRRLFVLLQKIFHRATTSPAFDVRHLCVDVLGFAATLPMPILKRSLMRCVNQLAKERIVRFSESTNMSDVFCKHGVGHYTIVLKRGEYFESRAKRDVTNANDQSPLIDPLRSIGLEDAAIRRVIRDYQTNLVREWADITLAARERHGDDFFRKSASAYFIDNLKNAAHGKRTPPDWWRMLRHEEMQRQRALERDEREQVAERDEATAFRQYLEGEARKAYHEITEKLVADLMSRGKSREDAQESGAYMARLHFLNRFRRERRSK